jgi:purine-binding chemotaxis protein CheW
MNPDRTTVLPKEVPVAGTSQETVAGPSETIPSEPPVSPTGEENGRGTMEASGNPTDKGEGVLELLAFQLADEEYAIDILTIKEIIRSLDITHVPRRPSFIKGIISLRGTIIPIYDLRTRLGLTESPPTRNTRVLVVEMRKGLIGIIADRVTEVVKVKGQNIEPPPATVDGTTAGHLKGVTLVNGRLIILLDLIKAVTL